MNILPLSFHVERTQPLSDLVRKSHADFYLTSEIPIQVYVSVMSSRGLTHFDSVQLTTTPYVVPYEPPLGSDWSVLQIQALTPRKLDEEPYNINLKYRQN
jgi:hypothetical protein